MDEGNGKATRLVLRCADDFGRFRCYLCHTYATSACTLYRHTRHHTLSDWRNMLPKKLKCCTAIVVRHKLPNPLLDEECLDEEECLIRRCDGGAVDLMKALLAWNATGRMKNKRGRSGSKNHHVLAAKKLKNDATCSGNVAFDVDLNEDPVVDVHTLD